MKIVRSLLLALPFLGACAETVSHQEANRPAVSRNQMMEATAEMRDLRRELHTSKAEFQILESRIQDQESIVSALRREIADAGNEGGSLAFQRLEALEDKLAALETRQGALLSDLQKVAEHSDNTSQSLSQVHSQMQEVERNLTHRNQKLEENIGHLKRSVSEFIGALAPSTKTYTVQAGDSLEKIARRHGTSIQGIKDANGLTSDLIRVGQKLKIQE